MKKKLLALLTLSVLSVGVLACGSKEHDAGSGTEQSTRSESSAQEGSKESEIQSSQEENKELEVQSSQGEAKPVQEAENMHTVDGITISANTFSVEPYDDSHGEYTKRIAVEFTIKNESDSAFGYVTTWEGRLSDGFKLEAWADLMSMDLKQVPAGGEKTDTAYFLINDSIDPDEITVSYNFMDYGEEYWADFGKIMTGEMGQDEYMSKYGNFEVLEFTVTKE